MDRCLGEQFSRSLRIIFVGSTRQVQRLGDGVIAHPPRVRLQEGRGRPPPATVEVCDGGGGTTSRGPQQNTQGTVSPGYIEISIALSKKRVFCF